MLDIRSFKLGDLVEAAARPFRAGGADGPVVEVASGADGRFFGDAIRIEKALALMLRRAGGAGARIRVRPAGPGATHEISVLASPDTPLARRDGKLGALLAGMEAELTVEDDGPAGWRQDLALTLRAVGADGSEAPRLENGGRPLRVLIAEDDPMSQRMMTEMIARTGAECELAADGHEAIAAWRRGSCDLILMDVRMPGCDGLTASREIRAAEAAAGLPRKPIVALTAVATPRELALCREAGTDAVISKPVQMDYLYETIGRVVGKGPAREGE